MSSRYHLDELQVGAHVETTAGERGVVVRREKGEGTPGAAGFVVIAAQGGDLVERPAERVQHVYADDSFTVVVPPRTMEVTAGRGELFESGLFVAAVGYELKQQAGEPHEGRLYVLHGEADLSQKTGNLVLRLGDGRRMDLVVDDGNPGTGRWHVRRSEAP